MDLVYLHGFASGPQGAKGTHCRDWAAARGIPFHAPDLNLPDFEHLTLTAQVEAVDDAAGRPGASRRWWWAPAWAAWWPPPPPTGARPWPG